MLEVTLQDVEFNIDLNISETTKTGSYEFSGTAIFDPAINTELEPYYETIRDVTITEMTITVTSITPSTGVSLLDASLTITDNVNGTQFNHIISTVKPLTAYTPSTPTTPEILATEFVIGLTAADFSVLSGIINDMHDATVDFSGHVNQTSFTIGFNVGIVADITVGVP
ncbi:MAG: hypothetical protein PF484_03575 [Bacteroidales bacterium]|nr:hypothetical protein [Bacteroidales bacterium]